MGCFNHLSTVDLDFAGPSTVCQVKHWIPGEERQLGTARGPGVHFQLHIDLYIVYIVVTSICYYVIIFIGVMLCLLLHRRL